MRSISGIWMLVLGLVGCDQLMEMIPGQEPEATVDTAAPTESVDGVVAVAPPPATAQENDDHPTRDGDTMDKLARLTLDMAKVLERYIDWDDPVDPFADELSGHEVPPFNVEVIDLQLIHPWMGSYRVHQAFTYTQTDLHRNEGHWGAAIVLEVRNDTNRVLMRPDFEFGLMLDHGYKNSVCAIDTESHDDDDDDDDGRTASLQVNSEKPWSAETSGFERFWRPGEVVRRQLVTLCGDARALDAGIGSGTVQVNIEADEFLGTLEHEMVGAVQQRFGADAFTLRKVSLGKSAKKGKKGKRRNREGLAYGSGVITFHEGRVHRAMLRDYGLRADSADVFTPIPGVMAPVVASMNELQVTLDSVEVKHWSDIKKKKIPKGTRRVSVRVQQTIDSAAIQDRLTDAIDEAKSARKQARQSFNAAEGALDAARRSGDRNAVMQATRAAANAQRNFDSAKRMVKVAKDSLESGVTRERERMGRALSCEQIRLVTPTREVSVVNGDRVRRDCAQLTDEDTVTTTLRYTIHRYEVPVGLNFNLGNKAFIGWVANQVTTEFDAR